MRLLQLPLAILACSHVLAAQCTSSAQELPVPTVKLEYKRVGETGLHLHLFQPTTEPQANAPAGVSPPPKPAIVFYFGGGWKNGKPDQFYSHCAHLAKLGVVAMSAEYRVHSRDQAQVVDCVADAQDAMLYVRRHAQEMNIDPQRIAAGGGSAGGHLAAAVATLAYRGQQSGVTAADYRPDALVLFNPAVALATFDGAQDSAYFDKDELNERMGAEAKELSPLHQVSAKLPPTLILHGSADTAVPIWTVDAFQKKAEKLGAHCTLVAYPDQPHGFFNFGKPNYEATRDEMTSFLRNQGWVN